MRIYNVSLFYITFVQSCETSIIVKNIIYFGRFSGTKFNEQVEFYNNSRKIFIVKTFLAAGSLSVIEQIVANGGLATKTGLTMKIFLIIVTILYKKHYMNL